MNKDGKPEARGRHAYQCAKFFLGLPDAVARLEIVLSSSAAQAPAKYYLVSSYGT